MSQARCHGQNAAGVVPQALCRRRDAAGLSCHANRIIASVLNNALHTKTVIPAALYII